MSNKQYLGLVVMLVIAGMLAFYWYAYRPSQIKIECSSWAQDKAISTTEEISGKLGSVIPYEKGHYDISFYDGYFERCLREKGL